MEELVSLERTGSAIRRMVRQHGRFPDDLRKGLRTGMKEIGAPLLADARRRASWSTRIPSSLRLATSFTKKQAGLSLVANRKVAPHARVYEGITGNAEFRHPVYGNREAWVTRSTRPFVVPAADLHGRRTVVMVNNAVDDAARAAGYGR